MIPVLFRNHLILHVARTHQYAKVMTGESCTRVAVKLLTNLCLGRGASLAVDTVNMGAPTSPSASPILTHQVLVLWGFRWVSLVLHHQPTFSHSVCSSHITCGEQVDLIRLLQLFLPLSPRASLTVAMAMFSFCGPCEDFRSKRLRSTTACSECPPSLCLRWTPKYVAGRDSEFSWKQKLACHLGN